jgi:glutamate/aspartate transport system permease protein
MNYNWNWHIFWEESPDATGTYLDTLLSGLTWTMSTALCAWAMALVLGIFVGTVRTLPGKWTGRLASAYIELFRNIPLLVQMFLWYFVVPELLPEAIGNWMKSLPNASFVTAVISLGFFTSARIAVQVSAGIGSFPQGQMQAAMALGLGMPQVCRYVLLPQALRILIPPLTNEFLNIIKNSAVALTIGLMELTARTRAMQEFSFQVFEAFTAATLIYVAVNIGVLFLMHRNEAKAAVPGVVGSPRLNEEGR